MSHSNHTVVDNNQVNVDHTNSSRNELVIQEFLTTSHPEDHLENLSHYHHLLVTAPDEFNQEFRSKMDFTFRSLCLLLKGLS